jgi:hypothetical protein
MPTGGSQTAADRTHGGLIKDTQQTAFNLIAAKNGPAARGHFKVSTEMMIHGSRTLMIEDRRLLQGAEKLLRPAFQFIATGIADHRNGSANDEYSYQRLGELIRSAYYIGAYTTITDSAQRFVAPALRKERAKVMRKGKTV